MTYYAVIRMSKLFSRMNQLSAAIGEIGVGGRLDLKTKVKQLPITC